MSLHFKYLTFLYKIKILKKNIKSSIKKKHYTSIFPYTKGKTK